MSLPSMGSGLDQTGGQQQTRYNVEVLGIFSSFFGIKKEFESKSTNLDDLTVAKGRQRLTYPPWWASVVVPVTY